MSEEYPEVKIDMTLSYGVLPTEEQFRAHFEAACPRGGMHISQDDRVGNGYFTCSEVWREVQRAAKHECGNERGYPCRQNDAQFECPYGERFARDVLYCIGIEWI